VILSASRSRGAAESSSSSTCSSDTQNDGLLAQCPSSIGDCHIGSLSNPGWVPTIRPQEAVHTTSDEAHSSYADACHAPGVGSR
jgi:hypothetical protein